MNARLILVRHGLTDWNASGRFQGQSDVPLSDIGLQQAEALANRLAPENITALYTSDLQRARSTAQVIHAHHSCPLFVEPGLREINFGSWEGMTYAEIQERDLEALERWQANLLHIAPPNGETLEQFANRIENTAEKILPAHPEGNLLLVAHGGSLQMLLCHLLGVSPQAYWQFHLSPASLSEIRLYPEGAILNLLNDACHLEDQQ